jgi:hypothetical protein
MTTKLSFEDRLLDQLRQVVATNPTPPALATRRWPHRRLTLAGTGVATATVAAVLVAMAGSGAPNAFAVDTQPNGTVTVHISSLSDATGLQSRLRAAGIPAFVSYAANCAPPTAPAASGTYPTGEASGVQQSPVPAADQNDAVTAQVTKDADGVTFKIDPGQVSPDQKVFITTTTGQIDSMSITIGSQPPPAAC